MLELWQTEWCPGSRRVRQRLTELGVDYVARQVPVAKEQRDAKAHQLKAAKARRRYLEEECECIQVLTP